MRNTSFARAMAESIGRIMIPPDIEEDTPEAQALRRDLGVSLLKHATIEFEIPGITYGVSYAGSDVVVSDGSEPPADTWNSYTPTTVPGAGAPHVWLEDGISIFDHFGRDLTLVLFDARPGEMDRATAVAGRMGVPLAVLPIGHPIARDIYGQRAILVRPDHHVAWRGEHVPDDFERIPAIATGQ